MEIFLVIDGQKAGPFTPYEVRDKLRSGKADPETKAWIKGMDEWTPLRDFAPLKNDVELRIADAGAEEIAISDEERAAVMVAAYERPRPWVRYWARSIDMSFHMMMVALLLKLTGLAEPNAVYPLGGNIAAILAIPASWIFVEAALLMTFGTTPGKLILNIRLRRADGSLLDLGSALRRSTSVWFRGMGMGIPPLTILCLALSHLSLTARGRTQWDDAQDLELSHGTIGEGRVALAVLALFGISTALYYIAGPIELALPQR